jgi:hypothetical protein
VNAMALPQTKTIQIPPLVRVRRNQQGAPVAQQAARSHLPGGDVRRQAGPPPKGVGGPCLDKLNRAVVALTDPIKELALPDCGGPLMAFRLALSRSLSAQAASLEAEATVTASPAMAETERLAAKFAEREEQLDASTGRGLEQRKQVILKGIVSDWRANYVKALSKRLTSVEDGVMKAEAAARQAVERAELRSKLDPSTPDPLLVGRVLRTVESEPTLRKPAKARELLETALRLNDTALLLALEALLPQLQQVIEGHLPALTRNVGNYRAGEPSAAMADAVWCATTLRGLRNERLAQPAVLRAREILSALQFLALKCLGVDGSDPYCLSSTAGLSPARLSALASSKLQVFSGKTGHDWVFRYVDRTSLPELRWPPLLQPPPMKLQKAEP